MDEATFVSGCIKVILEKYADPIVNKITHIAHD